jgi:hypothetical protein
MVRYSAKRVVNSASHGGVASSSGAHPSSQAMAAGGRSAPSAPSTPLKPNQAIQLPVIEDWQLPSRYRRLPLDAEEIAYINVKRTEVN